MNASRRASILCLRTVVGLSTLIGALEFAYGKTLPASPPLARPSLPYDPAGTQIVDLHDGSRLHGSILSISEKTVELKRSDASALLSFPLTAVSRLSFDADPDREGPLPRSVVQFRSGDWLVADILLLSNGRAELRLPNQHRISVEQSAIAWVHWAQGMPPDIYQSGSTLDGWNHGDNWSCQGGVFKAKPVGNLGRNLAVVPDRVDLQFEMEKGEVQRNFMLSFNFSRTDSAHTKGEPLGHAWSQIRINEGQLHWYMAQGNENKNASFELPNTALNPDSKTGKFHYRVLYDRHAGTMTIIINGKKVVKKSVPAMAQGNWKGTLNFQPMRINPESTWEISNIRILPWDGVIPNTDGGINLEKFDVLTMADGEIKIGRLLWLKGTKLQFRSKVGLEDIPCQSISFLRLHLAEGTPVPVPATGPTVVMTDRGEIRASHVSLADATIVLGTSFAKDLALPKQIISSLIYAGRNDEKPTPMDLLIFRNGDMLRGTLEGASADGPLRWRQAGGAVVEFQTKRVGGIRLRPASKEQEKPRDCVVRFRDGDWINGTMLKMDKESLEFESPIAPKSIVPRAKVHKLFLGPSGRSAALNGSSDSASWWKMITDRNQEWEDDGVPAKIENKMPRNKVFLDGAFSLVGRSGGGASIGNTWDHMPSKVELSFETASSKHSSGLSLQLFTNPKKNDGVTVQVWQGGMYIYDRTPHQAKNARGMGRGMGGFGGGQPLQLQWPSKLDANATRHRYQFFADRNLHQLEIFVDGLYVGRLNSRAGSDAEPWGSAFSVGINNPGTHPTIISNFWIAPSNGISPTASPRPGLECLALANGDSAQAKIHAATEQTFSIEVEGQTMEVPRERVLLADFGLPEKKEEPELRLSDGAPRPRIRLAAGGSVSTENLRIEDGKVTCENSVVGGISIPLSALSEIVWSTLDKDIQSTQSRPHKANPNRKVPKAN